MEEAVPNGEEPQQQEQAVEEAQPQEQNSAAAEEGGEASTPVKLYTMACAYEEMVRCKAAVIGLEVLACGLAS
jgi:hypothetical protein